MSVDLGSGLWYVGQPLTVLCSEDVKSSLNVLLHEVHFLATQADDKGLVIFRVVYANRPLVLSVQQLLHQVWAQMVDAASLI